MFQNLIKLLKLRFAFTRCFSFPIWNQSFSPQKNWINNNDIQLKCPLQEIYVVVLFQWCHDSLTCSVAFLFILFLFISLFFFLIIIYVPCQVNVLWTKKNALWAEKLSFAFVGSSSGRILLHSEGLNLLTMNSSAETMKHMTITIIHSCKLKGSNKTLKVRNLTTGFLITIRCPTLRNGLVNGTVDFLSSVITIGAAAIWISGYNWKLKMKIFMIPTWRFVQEYIIKK